jgi:hypothetical protein
MHLSLFCSEHSSCDCVGDMLYDTAEADSRAAAGDDGVIRGTIDGTLLGVKPLRMPLLLVDRVLCDTEACTGAGAGAVAGALVGKVELDIGVRDADVADGG